MNIQILMLVIFGSLYVQASPTCSNPTVTPLRNTWALDYTGQLYSVYFCPSVQANDLTWSFQDSSGADIAVFTFSSSLGSNPCQPTTLVPVYNATCQYEGSCYTTTFSITNKLTASFNQSTLQLVHGGSSCFAQNILLQECSSPTTNNVPVNPSSGVYNTQANFQCSHGSTLFNMDGTTGNTSTKCLATAGWENEKMVQCLTVTEGSTTTHGSTAPLLYTTVQATTTPATSGTPPPIPPPDNLGVIIGAAVGGVVAFILIIILVVYCLRKQRNNKNLGT
ncbi:uncharacterized protein LOC100178864 [Ciona intestinalis]